MYFLYWIILEKCYDTSKHVCVIDGTMTCKEAAADFIRNFDTIEVDNKVSFKEFMEYYALLSIGIGSD